MYVKSGYGSFMYIIYIKEFDDFPFFTTSKSQDSLSVIILEYSINIYLVVYLKLHIIYHIWV